MSIPAPVVDFMCMHQARGGDTPRHPQNWGRRLRGDACDGGGCCLDLQCIEGSCQLPQRRLALGRRTEGPKTTRNLCHPACQ
jgi:hypothetical protein